MYIKVLPKPTLTLFVKKLFLFWHEKIFTVTQPRLFLYFARVLFGSIQTCTII